MDDPQNSPPAICSCYDWVARVLHYSAIVPNTDLCWWFYIACIYHGRNILTNQIAP